MELIFVLLAVVVIFLTVRGALRDDRVNESDEFIYAKVVGVSYNNSDGINRQGIVKNCREGEALMLCHEPNNTHDGNAVAVRRTSTKEQIGYLERSLAADIVTRAAAGELFGAKISELTGVGDDQTCGVNIKIFHGGGG